jgi:hypothetical protein
LLCGKSLFSLVYFWLTGVGFVSCGALVDKPNAYFRDDDYAAIRAGGMRLRSQVAVMLNPGKCFGVAMQDQRLPSGLFYLCQQSERGCGHPRYGQLDEPV